MDSIQFINIWNHFHGKTSIVFCSYMIDRGYDSNRIIWNGHAHSTNNHISEKIKPRGAAFWMGHGNPELFMDL